MKYDSDEKISSIIEEIIDIYNDAYPKSDLFDLWRKTGISLRAVEEILAISCHNLSNDEAIQSFLPIYHLVEKDNLDFVTELYNLLSFASDINGLNRQRFIEKCAELHLATYRSIHDGIHLYPALPTSPKSGTAFIDLVSGTDFKNYFDKFQNDTFYYAVDASLFACEVLTGKAAKLGLHNFKAICKNVMDLSRSDISEHEIGVIRAKNIFCYVSEYLYVIDEHLSWLCTGGEFIFAEQASKAEANVTYLHKLVVNKFKWLIANGWGFSFSFGDRNNPLDLNQVIFTKGVSNKSNEEIDKLEHFYAELVKAYQLSGLA